MAASPFHTGKPALREDLLARQATRCGVPVVYVNQVGGNDELIFDGGSCAVSASGQLLGRARAFEEDLLLVDTVIAAFVQTRILLGRATPLSMDNGPLPDEEKLFRSQAVTQQKIFMAAMDKLQPKPVRSPGRSLAKESA